MKLAAICIAALLSHITSTSCLRRILSSVNIPNNHTIFEVVVAKLLYSTSIKLLEIVCYFLDFQETNDSPNFTKTLVTNLLVLEHAAQSVSQ